MKIPKLILGVALFLAAISIAPAQDYIFLTNGLVAYYPFDGNANDASGNGNNATVIGGAMLTTDRFGNSNNAYYFNGTNSWLQTSNYWPVLGGGAITVSCWIYYEGGLPTFPDESTMVNWGPPDTGTRFLFRLGAYNGVAVPCVDIGASLVESTATVTSNVWLHLTAVKPLNGNESQIMFFLNGALVPNAPGSAAGINIQPTDTLTIGKGSLSEAGVPRIFNGDIDDVRIYDRALSTNEVAELYAYESNPILLNQDLTNTSVLAGQNTSLSVAAVSKTPLSYQWYFLPSNGSGLAGAYAITNSGFVVGAVVTNGGVGYGNVPSVSFVGGGGSGARGYGTVSNGMVTGIQVTNAGSGYSALPTVVIGPPDGLMYGQTNATLNITDAGSNNLGNYFVVISNPSISITSSIVSLTLFYPPSIVDPPADAYVEAYGDAAFTVTAAGTQPFTYQWLFNGTNLPNATSSDLIVTNITPENLGYYSVLVTNNYGSITSSIANLYMYPFLEQPFSGIDTYWGQTNILSVVAWGSGSLDYQWYDNGIAVPNATNAVLTIPAIQFTNGGSYSVVVSSSLGSVTNTPEEVVVNPANTSLALCPNVVIQGTVGYTYIIQSTTDLSDTNSWVSQTNLTLTQPIEYWDDTSTDVHTSPQKYYRVLPGQ